MDMSKVFRRKRSGARRTSDPFTVRRERKCSSKCRSEAEEKKRLRNRYQKDIGRNGTGT